jgi:hypothetical protein
MDALSGITAVSNLGPLLDAASLNATSRRQYIKACDCLRSNLMLLDCKVFESIRVFRSLMFRMCIFPHPASVS